MSIKVNSQEEYKKLKIDEKWEVKCEWFIEYINSSKEIKEQFEEMGTIDTNAIIKKGNMIIKIGEWHSQLKTGLLRRYEGMSREEIEKDPNIPERDRKRMIYLMDRGLVKDLDKIWQDRFELLVEYINSSEEIKKHFEEHGSIDRNAVIEKGNKKVEIGKWLDPQKDKLMKKYQGMSIEEIEESKDIPERDKYRMCKLLGIGVRYQTLRITGQKIGQATFGTEVDKCILAEKTIKDLENKMENNRKSK